MLVLSVNSHRVGGWFSRRMDGLFPKDRAMLENQSQRVCFAQLPYLVEGDVRMITLYFTHFGGYCLT